MKSYDRTWRKIKENTIIKLLNDYKNSAMNIVIKRLLINLYQG